MIGMLARLPLFVLLLVGTTWVGWFVFGPRNDSASLRERDRMARAYHDVEAADRRVRWAAEHAAWLEGSLPRGRAALPGTLEVGLRNALVHLQVSLEVLPVTLHFVLVGVLGGALLRERLRNGDGAYASPTMAYFGRGVVLVGSLSLFSFALTPFALPLWGPYIAAVAVAVGGLVYAANLPLRL